MPIKKSAQKALRQTHKRTAVNQAVKVRIKTLEKKLVREIGQKKKNEAVKMMNQLAQALDKAAKNHVVTKNTAAHKKSHLQKAINKIG